MPDPVKIPKYKKDIGKRISDLAEKNFGNAKIASKEFKRTAGSWSAYQTGKSAYPIEKIYELAEFLECSAQYLLFGNEKGEGREKEQKVKELQKRIMKLEAKIEMLREENAELVADRKELRKQLETSRAGLRRSV